MYTFESRVRYSEVGNDGKLTLESLLDYFQDVSIFHSEDLGVGIDYLKERGMAWILSAWQIVVERYPVLGEKVVACTYPYEFKGFFGLRNFILKTEDGEVLAYANSIWILLNMEKLTPARPTEEMLRKYILEEPYSMQYADRKIPAPADGEKKEAFPVKRHHLDTNEHVNNGQYVRMAMEYVAADRRVEQLRVDYRKSAKLGDMIEPVVHENENLITVELNGVDGKAYAVIELTTEEKED